MIGIEQTEGSSYPVLHLESSFVEFMLELRPLFLQELFWELLSQLILGFAHERTNGFQVTLECSLQLRYRRSRKVRLLQQKSNIFYLPVYMLRLIFLSSMHICIPVCMYSHALQHQKSQANKKWIQNVHVLFLHQNFLFFQMVHLSLM